jgi:hypothetical protein
MLQYTMAGSGARLALIVHDTDAKRQWAYDRNSPLRQTERGARGSPSERLDGSRYEERLEDYLSMNSPFRDEDGCAHRRRYGSLYDR